MKIYWELHKVPTNEPYSKKTIVESGIIKAKGYDQAAEDILIPEHPNWDNTHNLHLYSDRCTQGWFYNVGSWRH